jgi:hypothetical protein
MWRAGEGRSGSFSPVKIVVFANLGKNEDLEGKRSFGLSGLFTFLRSHNPAIVASGINWFTPDP